MKGVWASFTSEAQAAEVAIRHKLMQRHLVQQLMSKIFLPGAYGHSPEEATEVSKDIPKELLAVVAVAQSIQLRRCKPSACCI